MIIKNIIIPTMMYGSEIYGCNEQRVKKIKSVLDSAITDVIKKKNFVRNRAYTELRIQSIGAIAAVARALAVRKWAESSKIIGDLIRNPVKNKRGTKLTWLQASSR